MQFFKYFITFMLMCVAAMPTAIAQRTTMAKNSKKPDGLYIFNDQIKEIFPSANIEYTAKTIKQALQFNTDYNTSVIIIVRNFYPTYDDLSILKEFIRKGNNVLVCATTFGPEMIANFKFDIEYNFSAKTTISFIPTNLKSVDTISSKYFRGIENKFIKYNEDNTEVLGVNSNGTPNFIKMKYGSGNLYVHLYPDILCNGFIIEQPKENYHYTEAVLSFLPRYSSKVIVKLPKAGTNNSYSGGDGENEMSFMSFVMSKPNLRNSLWVLLGVFALAILFGFKLLQRRIPVTKPITNNSMDFAKTMGDLYFNYKNNSDIAAKKIQYWKEFVRTKYQIPTTREDNEFWERLAKKSGADTALLQELKMNLAAVNIESKVSDKLLIQLSNNIDKFYKS